MPRSLLAVLILVVAMLFLAGCGNKGELVLPDQTPHKKHHKQQPESQPKTGSGTSGPAANN